MASQAPFPWSKNTIAIVALNVNPMTQIDLLEYCKLTTSQSREARWSNGSHSLQNLEVHGSKPASGFSSDYLLFKF